MDLDSDTANLINEANCGWVIPPENINLLAKSMLEASLLSSNELNIIGQNGCNFALEYLSKKNNLKSFKSLFDSLK